jgi:xylulokinase
MENTYVIAFDLGTSSMKGVLMDEKANILVSNVQEVLPYYPEFGWAESDPDIWWDAVCRITKVMLEETRIPAFCVKGIAFDAPAYGVIPMSFKKGKLYNDIIWLDNRSSKEAEEMNEILGGAANMDRPFTGKDALPKLPWLRKHMPDIWNEMDIFLDDVGYLVYRATGKYISPIQSASCVNVDMTTGDWDWKLIDNFDLRHSLFPKIIDAADIAGTLTEKGAQEMGLVPGIPVMGGMTDLQAIELGCGCVEEGDGALYIGTSAIISINTERNDPGTSAAAVLSSANGKRKMFMSTSEMAGGCIEWMIHTLYPNELNSMGNAAVHTYINDIVSSVEPGCDKLFFNVWLYGERNPLDDEYIRAGFINLNSTHERKHMTRAVFEGIAYNLHWMFKAIDETYGIRYNRIRVAGGATRSTQLMQILADVFNRPVDVLRDAHMSVAKGTGLLALIGIGVIPDFSRAKELVSVERTYLPNMKNRQVYDEGQIRYMELYSVLKEFYRKING